MFLRTIRIQHERIASYSDYPFSIPFVKRTDELKIEAPITFFCWGKWFRQINVIRRDCR